MIVSFWGVWAYFQFGMAYFQMRTVSFKECTLEKSQQKGSTDDNDDKQKGISLYHLVDVYGQMSVTSKSSIYPSPANTRLTSSQGMEMTLIGLLVACKSSPRPRPHMSCWYNSNHLRLLINLFSG